jgi:hypothetical protein
MPVDRTAAERNSTNQPIPEILTQPPGPAFRNEFRRDHFTEKASKRMSGSRHEKRS